MKSRYFFIIMICLFFFVYKKRSKKNNPPIIISSVKKDNTIILKLTDPDDSFSFTNVPYYVNISPSIDGDMEFDQNENAFVSFADTNLAGFRSHTNNMEINNFKMRDLTFGL